MGTYLDDVGFALTLTNLKPKFDALAEQIGDLDQLDTTAKTNLVAAVNEVLATANKKLDLIQLEPTSNRATVDIPTGGCVLVVTANHTVTLTFNGNAGDLVILVNNTTGSIRNPALSPVLPSNNIAVILMDGEHVGQSLFRTDIIPDSVVEVTGELNDLTTTSKTNLVAAINEIASSSGGSGGQITVQELGQIGNISALDNIKEYGIYSYDLLSEKCWLIVSYDAMAQSGVGYTSQYDFSAGNGIRWRNYSDGDWSTWEDVSVSLRNNLTATTSGQALDATQGRVLNNKIGDMNDLTTTAKNNLVSAINEIANGSGGFEDLGNVDIGTDGLPAIPYTGASRDGIYTFTCTVTGFLFSTNSGTSFWDVMIYKDNIYTRIYSDVPLPPPTWTIVGSSGKTNLVAAINEVNENAIITKTREGATSTDMGLISNLPIYTTDGGQIEYSGVFGDDKEVIPLINLILKWGTNTYKTTLFQSRYQPSSDTNGHIHQMLYWNNGETGIVPITRSIEINNQNETYWGVWTDCNGKEYSDLA